MDQLEYERLIKEFRKQDKLIAEGKMVRPKFIDGFDEEDWAIVREGWTLEKVINEIEGRNR